RTLQRLTATQGHRVITLIDGDGAIFSKDLISQGQQGGHLAARTLSDAIMKFLSANYGNKPYQLWVYLFYNRRGLSDTFNRVVGLGSLSKTLDEFHVGFNQATERFTMVDVGSMKEAADAKLKVHLQDDIQLPQTFKIVFGGCHDNGYVASLHSQITAGFGEKLILLKGYTQMATAIAALGLPFLEIPDLFMTQKLAPTNRWMNLLPSPNQMVTNTDITTPDDWSKMSTAESDEVDSTGTSYSRVLQRAAPSLREGTRERSPSTEASCESSYAHSAPGTRHVNPDVVEWFPTQFYTDMDLISGVSVYRSVSDYKHDIAYILSQYPEKPPPCTLFYLSNCKLGSKCKYAHDYLLNAEHFQEMRDSARLGPCPMINRGEACTWGDACCYGHHCPQSSKCAFFKLGICKFKGGTQPC
ncbi:hypothetical protein B0H12DRAFT_1005009, partial [Mycena haematopus]